MAADECRGARRILDKMADGIEKRARELGMLEARDVGKPVSECVNHDVARAARNLRFFAAAAQTWTHEAADSDAKFLGRDLKLMSVTQRPPVGVGAIVIPWNSPLMLATWNLGPCLAAGNTCVLKPSELAPLTSIALGEIANEAGLPPGVLNVVPGLGDAGAALVSHPDVDAVAFTGGVATGRRVMVSAAESLKRVTLELGGKSPNLVFADANLKRTARASRDRFIAARDNRAWRARDCWLRDASPPNFSNCWWRRYRGLKLAIRSTMAPSTDR